MNRTVPQELRRENALWHYIRERSLASCRAPLRPDADLLAVLRPEYHDGRFLVRISRRLGGKVPQAKGHAASTLLVGQEVAYGPLMLTGVAAEASRHEILQAVCAACGDWRHMV